MAVNVSLIFTGCEVDALQSLWQPIFSIFDSFKMDMLVKIRMSILTSL